MGLPVAKRGDHVVGVDTHVLLIPSPGGPVPTPTPLPFNGVLADGLASSVQVEHQPVATVDSVANNVPPHLPLGGPFQTPPANKGSVTVGSSTVLVEHKAIARATDTVRCCNDPADSDTGHVIAVSTVFAG
ncbi:MAG: PAAR domain-containing protein [Polyangiaceae bacterium]